MKFGDENYKGKILPTMVKKMLKEKALDVTLEKAE